MLSNDRINNFEIFVASEKEAKLSVTLEPDSRYKDSYHGLHPKFDESELRSFLKQGRVNELDSFWDLVKKLQQNENYMNIILPDREYHDKGGYLEKLNLNANFKCNLEISLLGRSILQMASHFGFVIKVYDKDFYNDLKKKLTDILNKKGFNEKGQPIAVNNNSLYWECDEKYMKVHLLGIWPEWAIRELCCVFSVNKNRTEFTLAKADNGRRVDNPLYRLLTFKGDWEDYYKLISSDIYYSGVMPCVRDIIYEESSASSGKVKHLVFRVIRTTFATLDTMDNPVIVNHDFFTRQKGESVIHKKRLLEFDSFEDRIQAYYLYDTPSHEPKCQRGYEIQMVDTINEYLHHSLNTHTIAVSANLITSDGYLIAGERGDLNIDANEFYCSTNGQTEFRDENVDFYRKSVFEDMPTLDYNSKYRVDLNQEIQRESVAELGIASFDLNWECYGVSYLSINNKIDRGGKSAKTITNRRMHFNVLMSNYILQEFRDVVKTQRRATERFENKQIKGIKVNVFKGKWDLSTGLFRMVLDWVNRHKSAILVTILFILLLSGKNDLIEIELIDQIDIVLIVLYLIISMSGFKAEREIRKHMSNVYYYLPKYKDEGKFNVTGVLDRLLSVRKLKGSKLHAIFRAMYLLYVLELSGDE